MQRYSRKSTENTDLKPHPEPWACTYWDEDNCLAEILYTRYVSHTLDVINVAIDIPMKVGEYYILIMCVGANTVSGHIDSNVAGDEFVGVQTGLSGDRWQFLPGDGNSYKEENSYIHDVLTSDQVTIAGSTFRTGDLARANYSTRGRLIIKKAGNISILLPPYRRSHAFNYTKSFANYGWFSWKAGTIFMEFDRDDTGNRRIAPGAIFPNIPVVDREAKPLYPGDHKQERQPDQTPSPDVSDAGSDTDDHGSTETMALDFGHISDSANEVQSEESEWPKLPPLRHPVRPRESAAPDRTVTAFKPNTELLEAWDNKHFDPGFTKEEVAAATVISHGSIQDGRDAIEKRDRSIERKTLSWAPEEKKLVSPAIARLRAEKPLRGGSLSGGSIKGGSETASSLGGGSLVGGSLRKRVTLEESIVQRMSTEQRLRYEALKKQDRRAADDFLWTIEVPPEVDEKIRSNPLNKRHNPG